MLYQAKHGMTFGAAMQLVALTAPVDASQCIRRIQPREMMTARENVPSSHLMMLLRCPLVKMHRLTLNDINIDASECTTRQE